MNNRIDLGLINGGTPMQHSASQKEESLRTVDLALLSAPASSQSYTNSNITQEDDKDDGRSRSDSGSNGSGRGKRKKKCHKVIRDWVISLFNPS